MNAECRGCGKVTKKNKPFCYKKCKDDWKKKNRQEPGSFSFVAPSDCIPPGEKKRREELLAKAKKGNKAAMRELRVNYKLTAIWNGKELVNL